MGISDYLAEVTKLTNTNLQLLQVLNESLTTDANHLSFTIDDQTLAIPSFISLENKINTLQDNFENLVNAPKTSEAYFTFDGDSQAIYMRGFEQGPDAVYLDDPVNDGDNVNVPSFYHENNNSFKDFLDPVPYLKFLISPISNDITSIDIRKVVAKSDAIKAEFAEILNDQSCESIEWGDMNKILYKYREGSDYVLYDTIQKLPVRSGQGRGIYVIKEVVAEETDENLNQTVVVKIDLDADTNYGYQNNLTYKVYDQTIERQLQVGDILINGKGTTKFRIESLNFNTGEIRLWNMYNGFANLTQYNDGNYGNVPISSILKFFSKEDYFYDTNYAKVPLEEDQYIYVVIAPLNDRMNIRASWGGGVLLDVYKYKSIDNPDQSFQEYYKNCRNIGDILDEMSKSMSNTISLLSNDDINDISTKKIPKEDILYKVVRINDHLSDNNTIKNIENLYKSKQLLKSQLEQVQLEITVQQNIILTTNFQDTTGLRKEAENKLISLNKQKSDIVNDLSKNMQAIAIAASSATIPIEKAKYRIRGFVDYVDFVTNVIQRSNITEGNIKGIQVQYQYVNPKNESVGKADSFVHNGNNFLFSDWNEFKTTLRPRIRTEEGTYEAYHNNSSENEPSFNQFDIPITQGEEVNIKMRIIYDFGYPFIQMTSDWCDVFTVEFPADLIQDVDVVDIISENNNDIETERFEKILRDNGVTEHVGDKINDQDRIYFHNPDNIASGFYTDQDRRVIPLSTKLKEMSDNIAKILGDVYNDVSKTLKVSVSYGDFSNIILQPYTINNLIFKDFKDFKNIKLQDRVSIQGSLYQVSVNPIGGYTFYKYYYGTDGTSLDKYSEFAETCCNITLTNTSDKIVKIFPLFPAKNTDLIKSLHEDSVAFDQDDYSGVYMLLSKDLYFVEGRDDNETYYPGMRWTSQFANQIITFRNNDPYTHTSYYSDIYDPDYATVVSTDNELSSYWGGEELNAPDRCRYVDIINNIRIYGSDSREYHIPIYQGTCVYPKIENNSLFMTPAEAFSYKVINPGESIIIPIMVRYNINNTSDYQVTKMMSFDIRTSLYEDPINYTIKFITGYNMTSKSGYGYSDPELGRSIYNPATSWT